VANIGYNQLTQITYKGENQGTHDVYGRKIDSKRKETNQDSVLLLKKYSSRM
ncbi:hypothetical protein HAX54_022193, partial [Datura stramonium]|nr:hypothetical protein [Datura stramonium]